MPGMNPLSPANLRQAPRFNLEVLSSGFSLSWNGFEFRADWEFEIIGEIHLDQTPKHVALWGPGRRMILPARWSDGLTGIVSLNMYQGFPGLVISGEILAGEASQEIDILPLLSWDLPAAEASRWRWLVNSGHQGFSGSVPLDDRLDEIPFSQDITVLRRSGVSLALGNLTFQRTNLLFSRRREIDSSLHLSALLAYGGVELPAGRALALESLLILPDDDPLAAIESYADAVVACVHPRFNPCHLGLYNQWYANWTPDSNNASADLAIKGAELLRASSLYRYGICSLGSGVWHDRAAFGEEESWPGQFPEGAAALCEQVRQMGLMFMHGGFWGKASECATVFRNHPQWMAQDETRRPARVAEESWGACPSPYYIPDVTLPEVQAWIRAQWQTIRQASTGFYWLDFYGTGTGINLDIERPARLRFHNRQLTFPFETDRLLTGLIRQVVGDDGVIGVYTSPTFNLIGLIDRARMALDCGAIDPPGSAILDAAGIGNQMLVRDSQRRWGHVKAVARNMAAAYFCHNRFWINDPDPAMVGLIDRPETLEEARLRVMLAANSGGFITIGEALDQIPPRRLALLKQILPPYGQAARPLDLLEEDVPAIFDLTVQTRWDIWHVVTLINWEEHQKLFDVHFDWLGIGGNQLIFELWNETFLDKSASGFQTILPPHCCRVFCVRPERPHPWLLATNLHVTQGGVEIPDSDWDWATLTLSGSALRPDGEGALFIHIPTHFQLNEVQINGISTGHLLCEPSLLKVQTSFTQPQIEWKLIFQQVDHGYFA